MKMLSLLACLLLALAFSNASLAGDDKTSSRKSSDVKERSQPTEAKEELSPMAELVNSVDICDTN